MFLKMISWKNKACVLFYCIIFQFLYFFSDENSTL